MSSRFWLTIFFNHRFTNDTDEKEISHQVLLKCDASLDRFWGWRRAAEHASKRKVSSICCQERPRFGVRRCSAAFEQPTSNRLDKTSGRKVWHNFWDTRLTYQKSYLARLNYVHQNAVKHGLVLVANQYRWCSVRWFEGVAAPAPVRSIYRFRTDALTVNDDFAPIVE